MSRRSLAYLIPLSLTAAGSFAAHALSYRIADPGAHALEQTGHGYLTFAPLALALALAFVLVGLAAQVTEAVQGSPGRLRLWRFAALPPVGFAVQEHLERLVHTGSFPLDAVTQPTFLLGLALQLPFALLALLATRALLGFARELGLVLRSSRRPVLLLSRNLSWHVCALIEPAAPAFAAGTPERGPPSVS